MQSKAHVFDLPHLETPHIYHLPHSPAEIALLSPRVSEDQLTAMGLSGTADSRTGRAKRRRPLRYLLKKGH